MIKVPYNKQLLDLTKTVTRSNRRTGERRYYQAVAGIYEVNEKFWLFTSVHGGKDGSLHIEMKDHHFFKVENVNWIRASLSVIYNIYIPNDVVIMITPCHPLAVVKRYGEVLEKQNVKVFTDYNNNLTRAHVTKTAVYICNGETTRFEDTDEILDPRVDRIVTSADQVTKQIVKRRTL